MDDGERQYEWETGRRLKKLIVKGDPAEGIDDGFDEGSATTLKLEFSNGNLLMGEISNTVISAKVYRKGEDVTNEYAATAFNWMRNSGNESADEDWNSSHAGMKFITVSANELSDDIQIQCTLTGTSSSYGSVDVNEQFIASHTRGVADSNDTLSIEDGTLFVTTDDDNYRLSGNELTAFYPHLNGSVSANAGIYHAQPTKTIEFKYNSAGLRVQKKVTANGKTEVTDYTIHGKLVTHMTVGNDNLHFFYDAQSRPTKVNFNSTTYTYLHNLQGDVVGIIDNTGNLVVEYKYDAWGKPISIAGSLADTLGKHNPFRYRGYIYDEETEMYYLKTRYYKSKMKRFVNADEILGNGKALLVHNLFSYCRNHPIRRKDGGGREDVDVYDEFCDIFANTYGVSFEEYVQMPFYDKIQDVVYETENYEFLGVTKETYIEDDRSRLKEDNATTANFLGLIPLPGWQAFMDAALNFALSISENTDRYTLGDIERESYTVSYKKREQYTYTDAYGIRLVLKIDYTIKQVFRIGAGKKNKRSYFDSKDIFSKVIDYSYEIWENGKKVN